MTFSAIKHAARKAVALATSAALAGTGIIALSVVATIPNTMPTHAAGLGGPVQLDGMDPVCHSTGESTGQYIAAVLKSLHDTATISTTDGSIAILGTGIYNACGANFDSADPSNTVEAQYLNNFSSHPDWTLYSDAASVTSFFSQLTAGTVTPKVIWLPDDWSRGGDVENVFSANAEAIANFVNAGGGLFANNGSYGWLSSLLPNAQFVSGGCNGGPQLSTDGQNAFPSLTNTMVEACWHGSFWGSYPGLVSLVEWPYDALMTGASPTPMAAVAIGGANVTMPSSFTLVTDPPQAIPSDTVSVIASAIGLDGTIYSGVTVDFTITSGPHAGWTASAVTGANGKATATLTYLADGSDAITATATVNGSPKSQTYNLDWAPAFTPTRYVDAVLGVMTAGTPYSNGVAADGRPSPTYSITSGALPAGLAMDSGTGAITGTPTTPGAFSFQVTATNGAGSAAKTFTGSVGTPSATAPSWSDQTLATPQETVAYSDGVLASAYPAATYSVSAGELPAGLALNATTGAITGTPTGSGSYSFSIEASNSEGSVSAAFSGTIAAPPAAPPVWTDTTISDRVLLGEPYSDAVSAEGTPAPTYAVTAGALPAGLALNATTGAITGTPTAYGIFSFTITASNASGSVDQAFSGTATAAPTWLDASIAEVVLGRAFSDAVAADAYPAATYSISDGALPAGLSLDANTGAITGTPTGTGSFSFEVSASNEWGTTTVTISGTISVEPSWSDSTLAGFSKNVPYADGIAAAGTPATTYSVTAGALPAGLSLDANTGEITGTPTDAGSYSFTITATNSAGSVSHEFAGGVVDPTPVWIDAMLASPALAVPYANGVEASSSQGITYSITAGSLPAGLTLDPATGAITGTPTAAGAYYFEITATADGTSPALSVTQSFEGTTEDTTPSWSDSTIADITAGVPFSDGLTGDSSIPVSYSITAGELPAGLTLDPATGAITGTVNTPGAYYFEITATSDGGSTTLVFSGTVIANPPTVTDSTLAAPQHGVPYSDSVGADSFASVTYSVSSGSLPAGLTLDPATGEITGTPTESGSFTFEITATSDGGSTTMQFNIEVAANPPTWSDQEVAPGSQGTPYSDFVGGNSFAPITYSTTAGSLPAGLYLDPVTGEIYGTPTASGSYSFEITATSEGGSVSISISMVIEANPPVWQDSTIGDGVTTVPFSDGVSATNTLTVSYSVTAGALPTGVSLNAATGALTGTPTVAGYYTFEITASSAGGSVAKTFTISIATFEFEPITDTINSGSDSGTLDFSTAPSGSTIAVAPPKATAESVPAGTAKVVNNVVEYTPATGFSGLAKVVVTITVNGQSEQREYVFTVNPAPVGSGEYTTTAARGAASWLNSPRAIGNTVIRWQASPNAIGYEVREISSLTAQRVRAKGSILCATEATSCTLPALAGPNTKYEVIALGRDNLRSSVIKAAYKAQKTKRGSKALYAQFATDSARLSALAKTELRAFAAQVKAAGYTKVLLIGNTDERGPVWYNNQLGKRRADAVAGYLKTLLPNVAITTASKGSSEPASKAGTKAARELNRRTDIYLS